jgi:formamidopyrimidine-DNA glycosylase
MPELPEVEAVARDLGRRVTGFKIQIAELRRERLAPDTTPTSFRERLSGSTVRFVHRRGKHILVDLDNGLTLITHLRMSGRFMLLSDDEPDPKFAHAVFHFSDAVRLVFDDQRHFGLMKIVETAKIAEAKEIAKLAPEPFSDEFSPAYLADRVRSSGRTLKEILLDQTKVCGVGNIYASEAMFLSGINPKKRGRNIGRERCTALHRNIKAVLQEAIELAASLEPHPKFIGEGVYGNGSESRWRIYDREGLPCIACGATIKRITQAGRSTYFCSKCQR